MAILNSVWRLWCLRKNLHSYDSCIQVSAVIAVNVNWWFWDGIALFLSHTSIYIDMLSLSHIHSNGNSQNGNSSNITDWIDCEKSQQTKQLFDNELWHLVCRYVYIPFIYLLSLAHTSKPYARTHTQLHWRIHSFLCVPFALNTI